MYSYIDWIPYFQPRQAAEDLLRFAEEASAEAVDEGGASWPAAEAVVFGRRESVQSECRIVSVAGVGEEVEVTVRRRMEE